MKESTSQREEQEYVYCAYIVRNGQVIYPKRAKYFRFPANGKKQG